MLIGAALGSDSTFVLLFNNRLLRAFGQYSLWFSNEMSVAAEIHASRGVEKLVPPPDPGHMDDGALLSLPGKDAMLLSMFCSFQMLLILADLHVSPPELSSLFITVKTR